MMLPPLATVQDAEAFGIAVSDKSLARASARVRGWLDQQITEGNSTVRISGVIALLPQRPVRFITKVVDAEDGHTSVNYHLSGPYLHLETFGDVIVEYSHGYEIGKLPDELVELVCQIAARLESIRPELAQGVQNQQVGQVSIGYGWDAWKSQSGLTLGEKEFLNRYWPQYTRNLTTLGG